MLVTVLFFDTIRTFASSINDSIFNIKFSVNLGFLLATSFQISQVICLQIVTCFKKVPRRHALAYAGTFWAYDRLRLHDVWELVC